MFKTIIDIVTCVCVCGALFSWVLLFSKLVNDAAKEFGSVVSKR